MRLLADENFNGAIIRGLMRVNPNLDVIRVQDAGLRTRDDQAILEWAARENRILLTHDYRTIPKQFAERIALGAPTAGVFLISALLPVGQAVEELGVVLACSAQEEWVDQIAFLPL